MKAFPLPFGGLENARTNEHIEEGRKSWEYIIRDVVAVGRSARSSMPRLLKRQFRRSEEDRDGAETALADCS